MKINDTFITASLNNVDPSVAETIREFSSPSYSARWEAIEDEMFCLEDIIADLEKELQESKRFQDEDAVQRIEKALVEVKEFYSLNQNIDYIQIP